MRVYALISSHVSGETLDLFMTQEAAEAELREILEDEPEWDDLGSLQDGASLVERGSDVPPYGRDATAVAQ